jgi:hypothetical protein
MTLEEQLARIAEVHSLRSVSIHIHIRDDGSFGIAAYAHGLPGLCGSSQYWKPLATEAITDAITDLNKRRFQPAGPELEGLAPMADEGAIA